jgi:DNA (cytosine-5)-methyltransferase 3A
MVCEPIRIPEYGAEDKARPLNAHYANNCGGFEHRMFSDNPNKQQVDMVAQPIRVGTLPRSDGAVIDHKQSRIYSVDGKSTNINANGGGQGAKTGLYAIPATGKEKPIYEVKDGLITIKGKQYPTKLADGFYIIRKLTVTECKRLQTVPEWYEFPVSDSQAYKMLGNGWTVNVIAHLIKGAV